MTKLSYAMCRDGKTVYAFLSVERCRRQVERLNLVAVPACEARRLCRANPRRLCTDWTWNTKTNGFLLPVKQ
jgi:hypothetical protein